MERRTVQLRVAGQTCRIVTTVSDVDLKRFVDILEERLAGLGPRGKPPAPHAMTLVALGLVHELEEVRTRAQDKEVLARDTLNRLIERIDNALEGDAAPVPAPAAPTS